MLVVVRVAEQNLSQSGGKVNQCLRNLGQKKYSRRCDSRPVERLAARAHRRKEYLVASELSICGGDKQKVVEHTVKRPRMEVGEVCAWRLRQTGAAQHGGEAGEASAGEASGCCAS